MKYIQIIAISAILILSGGKINAQILTIDLSTGVNNNTGAVFPELPLTFDDTWTATFFNSPVTGPYYPVIVGMWASGPSYQAGAFPGQSPLAKWVSAGMALPGNVFTTPRKTYFKATFYVAACNVQSAWLEFDKIGADDTMDVFYVNGSPHPLNNSVTNSTGSFGSATIPLGPTEITPGWNNIIVSTEDLWGSFNMFYLLGRLKVQTSAYLNFGLLDKTGHVKDEFCIGEDVFLAESGSNTAPLYALEISEMNGSNVVWTVPYGSLVGGWITGSPIGFISNNPFQVNLTKLFQNNTPSPVTFLPGKTYRVKLKTTTPCALELTREFKYKCCDLSSDPSFTLENSGGMLSGSSSIQQGTHTWQVFGSMNPTSGPYTLLATYTTPTFSMNLVNDFHCYYVKHTITSACGTECTSQSICNETCENASCQTMAPTGLLYDPVTHKMTWTPVAGALSYKIEVTLNDPACCGGAGGTQMSVHAINVSSASHILNPGIDLQYEGAEVPCFSWVIYAICPDGTLSPASGRQCSR